MSSSISNDAFVWTWLPGLLSPVIAGRLRRAGELLRFGYARSYLERAEAIALGPELPLRAGFHDPDAGLTMPACLRDGAPDSWGRRVILDQIAYQRGVNADVDSLDELTYLLYSGSDRFGANDFQHRADIYQARDSEGSLEELLSAAQILERGGMLPPSMQTVILHGTSIGGARPKAVLRDDDGVGWLAKFSSSTDIYPVIKAEIAGNYLARRVGVVTPDYRIEKILGRTVLLTKRFDRNGDGSRRHTLSGLTLVGLDEMQGRYATYPGILDVIREYSSAPDRMGSELYRRIAFNMAIGNTDDHARNHAVFWDGASMELTPAFDLTPAIRAGEVANQAMAYGRDGRRESSLSGLIKAAGDYDLSSSQAQEIVHDVVTNVRDHWDEAADVAELSTSEKDVLGGIWRAGRAILNPGTTEGLSVR